MEHSKKKQPGVVKPTDRVDDEPLYFYVGVLKDTFQKIREGQRVSYVVETDANGRRYATDIRLEDDEPLH